MNGEPAMPTALPDRLKALDTLTLTTGAHDTREEGVCATEAVAWLAGEEHSDHPECLSPVLGQFLRTWNDTLDDEGRQALKPYLPRAIGTAGDGHDELRGWLCVDWLIRVHTPAWLALAGVTEAAKALRELPPLRDSKGLTAAKPNIALARKEAAATWAATRAAAGAATWDAARAAAGAAARTATWDAAGDAARAAAGDAARAAAGAAARTATWNAAGAAARTAIWAATWNAAWDATWTAIWAATRAAGYKAARAKLAPTETALKASALELLDTMIDPGKEA